MSEGKAVLSIQEFCSSYGVGKTTTFEEINAGRLHTVKVGRRRLIPRRSAESWLDSLESAAAPTAA